MNTHETYVSFETAKLLKKAGFDWEIKHYYFTQNGKTELNYNFKHPAQNYNKSMATMDSTSFEFEVCSCPTLEVAQRWLRDVKGILLYMTPKRVNMEWKWDFWYIDLRDISDIEQRYSTKNFNTYEEAQETGIKSILELILKYGE